MKELLEFIIKSIVAKPAAIRIEEVPDQATFLIFADEQDKGLIIGKGGKIIKAIRTLLRASSPTGKTYYLKIA
jgi:predicted RNA-binding protein YlqC (UPF0109 family)